MERLAQGEASVGELARPLAMSLPAVIQHLHVLETSGIVTSTKTGRVRVCRLDPDVLDGAQAWFQRRRADWNTRLDRLGEYLAGAEDRESRSQATPPSRGQNAAFERQGDP